MVEEVTGVDQAKWDKMSAGSYVDCAIFERQDKGRRI